MAYHLLNQMEGFQVNDKGGDEVGLVQRLANWVRWFGRSLEHVLGEVAQAHHWN